MMNISEIGQVVGILGLLLFMLAIAGFGFASMIKEANRRDAFLRSQPPPPPPKPAWEATLEVEIENVVRHSELVKRMREVYATALEDEQLARTVNRLLERSRVEIMTGTNGQ